MIAALFVDPGGPYVGRPDVDPWCGAGTPPALTWGPSTPAAIGTGARRGNLESMSKRTRRLTPGPFAELLIGLARLAGGAS